MAKKISLPKEYKWFHKEATDRTQGFWKYLSMLGVNTPWLADPDNCIVEKKSKTIRMNDDPTLDGEAWKTITGWSDKKTQAPSSYPFPYGQLRYEIGITYRFRRSDEVSMDNVGIYPMIEVYDGNQLVLVAAINSICLRGDAMISRYENVIKFLFNKTKYEIVDSLLGLPANGLNRAWTLTKKREMVEAELKHYLKQEDYRAAAKIKEELNEIDKIENFMKHQMKGDNHQD